MRPSASLARLIGAPVGEAEEKAATAGTKDFAAAGETGADSTRALLLSPKDWLPTALTVVHVCGLDVAVGRRQTLARPVEGYVQDTPAAKGLRESSSGWSQVRHQAAGPRGSDSC